MENPEQVEQVVLGVVRGIARERSPDIDAVRPDQMLVEDLGLRSLDLARIVAKLELKLSVDPFAERVAITSIRTAGDLCAAYAQCFSAEPPDAGAAEPVRPAPRPAAGLDSQRELRKKARRDDAT